MADETAPPKLLDRLLDTGRQQLRLRTLRRDLDHFWIRLGKTSYRLVESGDLQHPALEKAVQRIRELEAEIESLSRPPEGD